jgi:hypothetical protein
MNVQDAEKKPVVLRCGRAVVPSINVLQISNYFIVDFVLIFPAKC